MFSQEEFDEFRREKCKDEDESDFVHQVIRNAYKVGIHGFRREVELFFGVMVLLLPHTMEFSELIALLEKDEPLPVFRVGEIDIDIDFEHYGDINWRTGQPYPPPKISDELIKMIWENKKK